MGLKNAKELLSSCRTRLNDMKDRLTETFRTAKNGEEKGETAECEERPRTIEVCGEDEEYIEIKARIRRSVLDRCGNVIQGLSGDDNATKMFGEFEPAPEKLGYGPGTLITRAITETPLKPFDPSELAGRKDYEWKPMDDTPVKKTDPYLDFAPCIEGMEDSALRLKSVANVRRVPKCDDPYYSSCPGCENAFHRAPNESEERLMDEYIAQKRKNRLERSGRIGLSGVDRGERSGHTKDCVPPTEWSSKHTF